MVTDTEKQIARLLNQFTEMYTQCDMEGAASLFSSKPNTTFVGIRAGAKRSGVESIKSFLNESLGQARRIQSITVENLNVAESEDVAWASADLQVRVHSQKGLVDACLRLTGVFEKERNKFKIAQLHISAPLGDTRMFV